MPRTLDESQREDAIRTAIEKELPLQGSARIGGSWKALRSRFLPRASGHELLCIAPPLPGGPGIKSDQPLDLRVGMQLGLSFRRGHNKCLFVTEVAGTQRVAINSSTRLDAMLIRRPSRVDQLQRRAFERTIVPADHIMAVHITMEGQGPTQTGCAIATDISAGGLGVRFPTAAPRWAPLLGASVQLEIRPLVGPAIVVDGLYRQSSVTPDGSVSWGFQFVGLEASESGRSTLGALDRIVRLLSH